MAMGYVKTSDKLLEDFIAHANKFNRALHDSVALMRRDYAALGEGWHDQQYRNVGIVVDELANRVAAVQEELDRLIDGVKGLREAVDIYNGKRIRN